MIGSSLFSFCDSNSPITTGKATSIVVVRGFVNVSGLPSERQDQKRAGNDHLDRQPQLPSYASCCWAVFFTLDRKHPVEAQTASSPLKAHQSAPFPPGLIQSSSQASLPGLSAWVEVGGIAPSLCLKAPPPQPIST
jgi:hypothetical protein